MSSAPQRVRAIWISDFHLGTRYARARDLIDFLESWESDYLYLVGDVVDGWALARSWYWTQEQNDVIQKILRRARKGTRVTYIPGNHDDFARDYVGMQFGRVTVKNQAYHDLLDGRQLLIVHGDEFDGIIRYAKWLQKLGAVAYGIALAFNGVFNIVRSWMGRPYWSLSAFLKQRTKKALQYIDDFEQLVAEKARQEQVDGVVCGHIHHADERMIDGIHYFNCGDWVESCTALVEHIDGRLELIYWSDKMGGAYRGDGYAGSAPELSIVQKMVDQKR